MTIQQWQAPIGEYTKYPVVEIPSEIFIKMDGEGFPIVGNTLPVDLGFLVCTHQG
jgi:hypothetical protein